MSTTAESGAAAEHAAVADWDAAYVLGALPPADRHRYEEHLAGCDRCRAAVGDLSGLPGLLGGVSLDQVLAAGEPAAAPPAQLLPRLMTEVTRSRRRRVRMVVAGGLAAAAAVAGVLVAVWPTGGGTGGTTPAGPPASSVRLALDSVRAGLPLTAQVTLVPQPWGTRVDVTCGWRTATSGSAGTAGGTTAPAREYSYRLYVTARDGESSLATSWTYGPGTTVEPVGGTDLSVDQIAGVDIRTPDGTVLLRRTR